MLKRFIAIAVAAAGLAATAYSTQASAP